MARWMLTVAVVLALCSVVLGQEMFRCYECSRWEVGIVNGGEDEDSCERPTRDLEPDDDERTPASDPHCVYCATETRTRFFDWVERKCIRDGSTCTNGTVERSFVDLDILDLDDATGYEVQVTCCQGELCNSVPFSGAAMRTAHFLLAALPFVFFFLL